MQDHLTYLWTDSINPGAVMWTAPELHYPNLCSNHETGATLNSDIYSLGSIILFVSWFCYQKTTVELDILDPFDEISLEKQGRS